MGRSKPFPPKEKAKCPVCRGVGEVKDFYGEWIICPQCWNQNKPVEIKLEEKT